MRLGIRELVSQSPDIVKMTMKLSLRRTKGLKKRYEVEKDVVNDGRDDEFEELLERIGDEEFLIEKIVEKVNFFPVLPNKLHSA